MPINFKNCALLLFTAFSLLGKAEEGKAAPKIDIDAFIGDVVVATKQIELGDFPEAFNPSLIQIEQGFLLSFRFFPDRDNIPNLSYIGVVLLDEMFEQISKPELLNTRSKTSKNQSDSQDARIFSYKGKTYLIYNDNVSSTSYWDRREMFIAELLYEKGHFSLATPLRLSCETHSQWWEKNWYPFEWKDKLLLGYTINPHTILYTNFLNGDCYSCYETNPPLEWSYGTLRGGTPAVLVDGEYLAFFHSGIQASSESSWGWDLWHYFMGAYTFSPDPPFQITQFTPDPIVGPDFYTQSNHVKRVIFPGGFIVSGPSIYLAYGKDDFEIWIATLDRAELKKALVPVGK